VIKNCFSATPQSFGEYLKKTLMAVCVLIASFASAHATEDFCVRVKKTPDGFLAVRAKPTIHSVLLEHVNEGMFLNADTRGIYDHPEWTHVWATVDEAGMHDGWVATKYVEVVPKCPDAVE
jgi:hypothetical protein